MIDFLEIKESSELVAFTEGEIQKQSNDLKQTYI